MTKEELLQRLAQLQGNSDKEVAHIEADELLLEYIADAEIRAAYDELDKWYA